MNIYNNKNIFNESKYTRWYYSIIDKAKGLDRHKETGVFENHHILPASLFPEFKYRKNNMVLLTLREHFIVHALLIKMTAGNYRSKMAFALYMFKKSPCGLKERYINSSIFNNLVIHSKHTEEYKEWWHKKIAPKFKGKGNPRYGATLTNETKTLISNFQKQYMWINDGSRNKKVLKTSFIPEGYKKGRLITWKFDRFTK